MKVSVCVPIYGVEKYIAKCAESLFAQTMQKDIEFIFVNDCTRDKSMEVLAQVIKKHPHLQDQIKIVHHAENKGLTGARNTALQYASGDYIIHCDSDDTIEKNFCEALYNAAVSSNADAAACPILLESGNAVLRKLSLSDGGIDEWFANSFHSAEFNSLCNKLFARHIALDKSIQVPDHITMAEDLLRTTQMLLKCRKGVFCSDTAYHYYYGNAGSSTMNYSQKTFASEKTVTGILSPLLAESHAQQQNVCQGLLLFSGLCSQGVSLPELRNAISRQAHRAALKNPGIAPIKRLILTAAYISMPLAKLLCRLLVKAVKQIRAGK